MASSRTSLTIALRPFANATGDAGQDYVCDGLAEDVAVELARFRSLFTVVRVHAQETKVPGAFALGGIVRRMGEHVRVMVDLVDDQGVELWAERYDRTLAAILDTQGDLASRIAAASSGRILALGVERARRAQIDDPNGLSAFDALALGLEALNRYSREDNERARALFMRVLALGPASPRATAGLASTYLYEWMYRPDDALLARAYDLARHALTLDNADAWCQLIVGRVHLTARRFELAEHFYERALVLNPNDTDVLASRGAALAYLGRPEEALASIVRAKTLNPYHPDWYDENQGLICFVLGDYAGCLAALERVAEAPSWVHAMRGAAYVHLGDVERARAAIAEGLRVDPTDTVGVYAASECYRRPEDLERFLSGLRGAGMPA